MRSRLVLVPVGGRLPSEAQLAEKMGSQPAQRCGEALMFGSAAGGLIQSRPVTGNYVCNPGRSAEREFLILLEKEESCVEIVQVRGLLEPPAAIVAASQRTDEDVVRLWGACDKATPPGPAREVRSVSRRRQGVPPGRPPLRRETTSWRPSLGPSSRPWISSSIGSSSASFRPDGPLRLGRVVTLQEEIANRIIEKDPQGAFERMDEHWRRMRATWGT